MGAAAESRWRRLIRKESDDRNRVLRELEAAHMDRSSFRAPAAPARQLAPTKAIVRRWMDANRDEYETATQLVEAANAALPLPAEFLDDETHWVWDLAISAGRASA